jgi:hypothetical protein
VLPAASWLRHQRRYRPAGPVQPLERLHQHQGSGHVEADLTSGANSPPATAMDRV